MYLLPFVSYLSGWKSVCTHRRPPVRPGCDDKYRSSNYSFVERQKRKKCRPITCEGRWGVTGFCARQCSMSRLCDGGVCLSVVVFPSPHPPPRRAVSYQYYGFVDRLMSLVGLNPSILCMITFDWLNAECWTHLASEYKHFYRFFAAGLLNSHGRVILERLVSQAEQIRKRNKQVSNHEGVPPNKYTTGGCWSKNIWNTRRSSFITSWTSRRRSIVSGMMALGDSSTNRPTTSADDWLKSSNRCTIELPALCY